ncbi:Protein of unknown function [Pseudomonas asturiensis]|uniref:DUF3077 domain-containing protein n=1 Tax=Pseudomonas asturiensis TaxID=1190415 RepID=A0A1M7P380_9PSED|nr:DUF3077 domain-containing protein [Pseudomonas asturiensis]SHN11003.1 Protein of unknown function [Pseudomonas asturiensis]
MREKLIPDPPNALYTINPSVTQEQALNYASDLLRCIITTAYESGDNAEGTSRDLVFAVLHMAELAKAMVDRSLDSIV